MSDDAAFDPDFQHRFTDSKGVEWSVREVIPGAARLIPKVALARPAFAGGWLLFSCDVDKRRLAPYPTDWRTKSPAELESLCHTAHRVAMRPQVP
jgi:hypothetical protein